MKWSAARLAPAALGAALACSSAPPPAPPLDPAALGERLATAFAAAASGAPERVRALSDELAAREAGASATSGLVPRLDLLAAALEPDRAERVREIEAARDATTEELFQRTATHLLEQDDAYLARELTGNRVYSRFASFFNGVVQMGVAVVTANPVGVLRPVVDGVEAAVDTGNVNPADRKLSQLQRRFLLRHPDGAGLPDRAEEVAAEAERIESETFDLELLLAAEAERRGQLEEALAHLHAAATLRPEAERIATRETSLQGALGTRAARRVQAIAVRSAERDAALLAPDAYMRYRELAQLLASGRGAEAAGLAPAVAEQLRAAGEGELAAAAEYAAALALGGSAEAVSALGRLAGGGAGADPRAARAAAALAGPGFRPLGAIEAAKAEHAARRRAFVFTGRRPVDDPLARYAVARAEQRRSFLAHLEPLLWVPATLVRAVYTGFADPIDEQPVVDALADFAWQQREHPQRNGVLGELSERYERRGETWKALAAATAAGEDPAAIQRLRRAVDGKRARLASERAADAGASAAIPAVALAPLAAELKIDPRLVDGSTENGEVARPGFLLGSERIEFTVVRDGAAAPYQVALDPSLAPRVRALADEWSWLRRALAQPTYRELHEGVPVELYAGVGLTGFTVVPRLLPEGYQGPDKKLYE